MEQFQLFNHVEYKGLWCIQETNNKRFRKKLLWAFEKKEDAKKFLSLLNKAKYKIY